MLVPVPSRRSHVSLALFGLLAACAAPRPAAPPPAPPRPAAPPIVTAPRPTAPLGWQDAPLTPGDWRYRQEGAATVASFADGAFEARCDTAARVVRLSVVQPAAAIAGLTITTSDGVVALPAGIAGGRLSAQLAGADGKLDGIAFSRGRFAVSAGDGPKLIIPAWPEFARVVEDCRRPA